MSLPTATELAADGVLWPIVEEHLNEAEFLVEQFDRAFDSPLLTLARLAANIETRLLAHLDALLVGGPPVYERLCRPVLMEPDPEQPARIVAAALVAIQAGHLNWLWPALSHDDDTVRAAAVRAAGLSGGAQLERWVIEGLSMTTHLPPKRRASLLAIASRLRLQPPVLVEWLTCDDACVARAAAEAARHADPQRHLPAIEWLLEHSDERVREAALIAAWTWGSRRAPAACERWALDVDKPREQLMALYASMGGQAEHDRLTALLQRPSHRRAALFALGFSGSPTEVPRLLEYLDSKDPVVAKLAAQATSMITGFDVTHSAFVAKAGEAPRGMQLAPAHEDPEARASLPSLDGDDLEADLVPAPEDALPPPNVGAIRQFCKETRLAGPQRYIGGQPMRADVVLGYLEHAPLRRRHSLALALSIQNGGRAWVDTRAYSLAQRRAIKVFGAAAPVFR
jgi:uncharacterized protein (TIGR02270 family)